MMVGTTSEERGTFVLESGDIRLVAVFLPANIDLYH